VVQVLSEGHNARAPKLKLVGHVCARDPIVIGTGLL